MQVVRAGDEVPESFSKSILVVLPEVDDAAREALERQALAALERQRYDGVVLLDSIGAGGRPSDGLQERVDHADVVAFWAPGSPDVVTSVQFGALAKTGKVVLGTPPGSASARYLEHVAGDAQVPVAPSLDAAMDAAVEQVGNGALRRGGERQVPLHIWRTPQFQRWIAAQRGAGNRLDGAQLQWVFRVGPQGKIPLSYAIHVDVHVAAEGRNKRNEFILGRPDIAHTVAIWPHPDDPMRSRVVLVREFRSTASTPDGFIRETPGGSSFKGDKSASEVAAAELFEETGLRIDPARVHPLGRRQLAGTFSTHQADVGVVRLTRAEVEEAARDRSAYGNAGETEMTFREVHEVRDLLGGVTDWSNLGMILQANEVARKLPFPLLPGQEPAIVPGTVRRALSMVHGEIVAFNLRGGGAGGLDKSGTVLLGLDDGMTSVMVTSTEVGAQPMGVSSSPATTGGRRRVDATRRQLVALVDEVHAAVAAAGGTNAVFADPAALDAVAAEVAPSPASPAARTMRGLSGRARRASRASGDLSR